MVAKLKPNEKITFTIIRDGSEITRTVKIGKLPGSDKQASLIKSAQKLNLASLGLSFANKPGLGVVVSAVDADGPASAKGIKRGDVVLEVSGKVVASPGDIEERISKISKAGKKTALFLIKSKRGKRFIALSLGKA